MRGLGFPSPFFRRTIHGAKERTCRGEKNFYFHRHQSRTSPRRERSDFERTHEIYVREREQRLRKARRATINVCMATDISAATSITAEFNGPCSPRVSQQRAPLRHTRSFALQLFSWLRPSLLVRADRVRGPWRHRERGRVRRTHEVTPGGGAADVSAPRGSRQANSPRAEHLEARVDSIRELFIPESRKNLRRPWVRRRLTVHRHRTRRRRRRRKEDNAAPEFAVLASIAALFTAYRSHTLLFSSSSSFDS